MKAGVQCFWRKNVKQQNPVMVCGAMSSSGVGPLAFLKSTVSVQKSNPGNSTALHAALCWPAVRRCWFYFLATHWQRTQSCFTDCCVAVLDWPAKSSDLTLMENLWNAVMKQMRASNADDLKTAIKPSTSAEPQTDGLQAANIRTLSLWQTSVTEKMGWISWWNFLIKRAVE